MLFIYLEIYNICENTYEIYQQLGPIPFMIIGGF